MFIAQLIFVRLWVGYKNNIYSETFVKSKRLTVNIILVSCINRVAMNEGLAGAEV